MSACIVFQQNQKSYVASDGAVSVNFGKENIRIKNNYKKTFCYENNLIFCSGRIRIVESIVSEIKRRKNITIEDIVLICKNNFVDEGLLELFLTKFDKCIVSYQLSSYNNFAPIKRIVEKENTEVLSLGFNAGKNLERVFEHIGKYKSIEEMVKNIYMDICCAEVGGVVDIYEISYDGIKNSSTIDLKDKAPMISIAKNKGNLVVAETIVGKMLIGQNLIIANENNSMIIDKDGILVDSNCLKIKGIEGGDYTFQSYFEMINNQISLGVKNSKDYTDAQIKVTSDNILLAVKDKDDELQGEINVTKESVKLGVEDAKKHTNSQIEIVNNAINQKVSNGDFESYKAQTASEISQKVSNGDFDTLFSQTAYGFDFIGKITTKSDNYKLELNANKLIGFRGSETHNPMYSAGVWWPNGAPAGYVSVSKGNAETVDTDGALWMTAYPNDRDKAAGIQYMKKHNDGTYVGSIIEFSEAGSISLVGQKTTGAARYGLWSHPDGYVYPYQGDEQLGSNIKPWNKIYCNNLYYKNYSTPFSNSTLAESYQVTALNEEVSMTLVTSEVEKYKDDNSFYTFYKDKFESLVYTDGGNKDRLVVNPNSMLNDPIASILVSKDGDELLLDNNSYITSLTMALKRSIEKIEKLENRIKVLKDGV